MDAKLKRYSVSLYEKPDDIFKVYFECKAQSPDHAFSAARHLYPGCKILNVTHQAQKAFGPDDLQEHRLLEVYELWDRLSDVPVNEQEQIDVSFEHFAKDTPAAKWSPRNGANDYRVRQASVSQHPDAR